MDLVLRNFRPGDEEAFRLLNEEWIERYFRLEEKDRETLNNPRKILDAGGQIVMALLGEERVGCCALICTGADEFEIAKMTVTDKYRGRGFGRAVLAGTIDEARRIGRKAPLSRNQQLPDTRNHSLRITRLPASSRRARRAFAVRPSRCVHGNVPVAAVVFSSAGNLPAVAGATRSRRHLPSVIPTSFPRFPATPLSTEYL